MRNPSAKARSAQSSGKTRSAQGSDKARSAQGSGISRTMVVCVVLMLGLLPAIAYAANTQTNDYDYSSHTGALMANGTAVTSSSNYSTSTADQNVALVKNGGTLTSTGGTWTKSGDDTNGDNCNFYGINSIMLGVGSASNAYVSGSTLNATSQGSNGIFSTSSAHIFANNDTITTTAANSRGLDATYGGYIIANLMDITTAKDHCASIASDRGGGYISCTNSTLSTAGSGSPLIYSTGDLEVDNCTGTATGSQIAGMEGLNDIIIYNSNLASTNDAISGSDPIKNGVILYQSTSGDADTSTGSSGRFDASDSTLSSTISSGAMFYCTNTTNNVVLSNTTLDFTSSGVDLIDAIGNSKGWGTTGSNGATVNFTGIGETLHGAAVADTISTLKMYLLSGTTWTGTASISTNSAGSTSSAPMNVNIDGTSKWIVTGNSTVTNLSIASGGSLVDASGNTVKAVNSSGTVLRGGTSSYTVTVKGAYSTSVTTSSANALSTSFISRTAFDSHYGTSTTFGDNGGSSTKTSIADATFATVAAQTYTGSAITPAPAVTLNGTALTAGTDFTYGYSDNTDVGTATITITGKGSYTGTASTTFAITAAGITTATLDTMSAQTYTGSAITPDVSLSFNGAALVKGTDYTLAYSNNTNVGTATVTITGIGNFTGTRTTSFSIKNVVRLYGTGALDTMSSIVTKGFSTTGGTVVIATDGGYWDALTAAGLAGNYNAPVLMTNGSSLSSQTAAQLKRLLPLQVIIVGGTGAITDTVETQITSTLSSAGVTATVKRYFGSSACDTAVALYGGATGWSSTTCIIATSDNFQDALSAAPYAYSQHVPIFLTASKGALNSTTLAKIKAAGFTEAIVVGGTGVIPDSTVTSLTSSTGVTSVTRLAGSTCYGTSQNFATWELSDGGMQAENMGLATGDSYYDALSGATFCGSNDAVIVLACPTDLTTINGVVKSNASSITTAYVFGGTGVLPETVTSALMSALAS